MDFLAGYSIHQPSTKSSPDLGPHASTPASLVLSLPESLPSSIASKQTTTTSLSLALLTPLNPSPAFCTAA